MSIFDKPSKIITREDIMAITNNNIKEGKYVPLCDYFNKDNTLFYSIKTAPIFMRLHGGLREFPAFYPHECFAISNTFPRMLIGNRGTSYDMDKGCRKAFTTNQGYDMSSVRINLDGTMIPSRFMGVQRIVLMAHSPDINEDKLEANHEDKDRKNNYYNPYDSNSNLDWRSSRENMRHAIIVDKKRGKGAGLKKEVLTDEKILMVCDLASKGYSNNQISEMVGISKQSVISMLANIRCKTVYSDLDIPDIPYRHQKIEESFIRRVCELLSNGLLNTEVLDVMLKEGYKIDIGLISKIKRNALPKWKHVVSQYDLEHTAVWSQMKNRLSDTELELICSMIKSYHDSYGFQYADIYELIKDKIRPIEKKKFKNLCANLRMNKIVAYRHISSKYFS